MTSVKPVTMQRPKSRFLSVHHTTNWPSAMTEGSEMMPLYQRLFPEFVHFRISAKALASWFRWRQSPQSHPHNPPLNALPCQGRQSPSTQTCENEAGGFVADAPHDGACTSMGWGSKGCGWAEAFEPQGSREPHVLFGAKDGKHPVKQSGEKEGCTEVHHTFAPPPRPLQSPTLARGGPPGAGGGGRSRSDAPPPEF